jgi:hypothetical protein
MGGAKKISPPLNLLTNGEEKGKVGKGRMI